MRKFLERNVPPGVNAEKEQSIFTVGVVLSLLVGMGFFITYTLAYKNLFQLTSDGRRVLGEGAQMMSFCDCLGLSLAGFVILSIVMLSFTIYHYRYCRQESMSVYLLRRLPQRGEYHRRIWLLPVLGAVIALVLALVLGALFLTYYLYKTPQQCLPENIWQGNWREERWLWY